jgi:hypothetical protein
LLLQAPEAKPVPPPDEQEFPSLGLGAQAAVSKGSGGKKGKRVKGRKMALDEFNSVGGGLVDERAKIMSALPKHATGEEVPDRFNRGGAILQAHHKMVSSKIRRIFPVSFVFACSMLTRLLLADG